MFFIFIYIQQAYFCNSRYSTMKVSLHIKFLTICLAGIAAITQLSSCQMNSDGDISKNLDINKELRSEIGLINDQLYKAIAKKDMMAIKGLMSDSLLEKLNESFTQIIGNMSQFYGSGKYKLLDEYHINNSEIGKNLVLSSGDKGKHSYTINFPITSKNHYLALVLPEMEFNGIMMSVFYSKTDAGWKINNLQFGQYSIMSLAAPDFLEKAMNAYGKGYWIDALNYADIARICSRPCNEFMLYINDSLYSSFADKVLKEVKSKYVLPMTIGEDKNGPELFRINADQYGNEVCPMVWYKTAIPLKDTGALRTEFESSKVLIYDKFTGLNKDKKHVIYRIYNTLPSASTEPEYKTIIDELPQ